MAESINTVANDPFPSPTVVIIAVVSLMIYIFLLRPKTDQQRNTNAATTHPRHTLTLNPNISARANNDNINATNIASASQQQQQQRQHKLSEAAQQVLADNMRLPPHIPTSARITKPSDAGIGGVGVLVDGVVAFKYTGAPAIDDQKRKDRAKVLSKILASTKSMQQPPSRGCTMVLGLQESDLDNGSNDAIQRVICCLASHYNVFVLVQTTETNDISKNVAAAKQAIQKKLLNKDASFPAHRIILTASAVGRVALVRQLQAVEWVIDFDASVQTELTRFGYKVYLYKDNLGKHMLPTPSE